MKRWEKYIDERKNAMVVFLERGVLHSKLFYFLIYYFNMMQNSINI